MAGEPPVVVSSPSAKTTSGNSTILGCPSGGRMSVLANVTAVSGTTPSMTLSLQWSHDGGTTWADADPVDGFTAITATGPKVKDFAVKAPHVRLAWAITGTTPSFTFDARSYVTAS